MSALNSLLARLREQALIYSGPAPAWHELEAAKENTRRILRVIVARWIVLGLLLIYGVFTYALASLDGEVELTLTQQILPVVVLGILTVSNGWYHLTYTWWARVRFTNVLQLLLDMLVITVLVHLTGGVFSWLWTLYLLLALEAAILLENQLTVWAIGLVAVVAHGSLLLAEHVGWIRSVAMPFTDTSYHYSSTHEWLVWGWTVLMIVGVIAIGSDLMSAIRRREALLHKTSATDSLTGLYNSEYFCARVAHEVARCTRFERTFALLVLDLDGFEELNQGHGYDVGDFVLEALGGVLGASMRRGNGNEVGEVDIACRYGGESFAIVMPETTLEEALVAAERLRDRIASTLRREASDYLKMHASDVELAQNAITATIGVSAFPDNGSTCDGLIEAAEAAVRVAKEGGRNRVVRAEPGEAA